MAKKWDFPALLLALVLALSLAPISAFAADLNFLPEGVTYSKDTKHTYHTQVNVTANISVKDSTSTVLETAQVSKSTGEFLKGAVGMLQSNLANLQTEIEAPYQAKGTITRENGTWQTAILDHFETATFYTFTPTSGDPVEFSTDLDAAKTYFEGKQDATGTFTELLDMHEYQKHNYTYDLIVQQTGQSGGTTTGGYYYSPSTPTITAVLNGAATKSATDYSGGIYGLTFKSTASFSSFQGVQVDGKALDKSNYIAEEGSIEVYLKAVYLQTLAAGKHTVTILSTEGNATAEFTIGGSSTSPKTADAGVALYAAAALLSIAGLAWSSKRRGQ